MPFIVNPSTGQILFTEDATAYLQQGYREPTADELEQSARREEFGTFGQQAQAQGERIIRGATFGAVEGFGSPEDIRARAEVSEELSPVISAAASIAPDVAVGALTGGLGGLATGAGRAAGRAALAEGAGIVRAGLAAARAGGAAALAGESLGTGLVTAGQQAYAEGRELGDDPGADAENVLIWGGLNFGLGAAMGALSRRGAAPAAADEVVSQAELDDIAKAAERRAPEAAGVDVGQKVEAGAVRQGEREAVEQGLERALRRSSQADAEDLIERAIGVPEREADGFARQRRLYINREAIYDVAEREMSGDLGKLVADVEQVARADKQAFIAAEVSDNLPAQKAMAGDVAREAAKFAGELRAEARAYAQASLKKGLQYPIPGAKALNLALLDNASAVAKAKTGRELFEALDNFKRTAQEMKLSLEAGALNSANPIHHQKLIPRVDDFARRIRGALENSGTWGKAGEMQRAYNAVIADKLMPSMRIFEESVLQRTHRGYDGVWKMEGWETKVRALLKNSDPGNRRHVAAVLDGMDELAGVRRQFGDPKMAQRIEQQTAKVRRTLGLADEVADATERMQAIGELVGGVPYGGAIAGGLAGGLPGAAIGAVLPGAVRGFVMGDMVSAFQRLSGATEAAAKRGVDDWIRSSRVRAAGRLRDKLPALPELSGEAKQLRDIAVRRGISTTMLLFQGEHDSPGAAFEELRDKLLDEEGFYSSLGEEYGTLLESSPETFMALSARADLARRFLIQRMPPNVAVSLANPDGYPPSNHAVEDWALYVNAVRHPERVVRNIGGARMQEIETLRTVHPRLHEQAQMAAIEGITEARRRGEQLDDSLLARLAILFPDADGVGSPVFSKEFGQYVRDWKLVDQQQRAQRSGGGSKPRQLQPSPMQATIEQGATFGTVG
jgi:hypothetical protein